VGSGDGGVSFTKHGEHLDGELLHAPVTFGPFTSAARLQLDAASLAACLPVWLPMTTPISSN
jgi:hypothetical protein